MAIRTALWKVAAQPQALVEAQLPSEKLLEDMIVAAPKVLSGFGNGSGRDLAAVIMINNGNSEASVARGGCILLLALCTGEERDAFVGSFSSTFEGMLKNVSSI